VTKHVVRRSTLALILFLLTARVSTMFAQAVLPTHASSQSAQFDPSGGAPDPTGGDGGDGGPDVAVH
jgi:hypothetical protein